MTEIEAESLVQTAIDRDKKFRQELEDLITQGLLELAEQLIRRVVGITISLADRFWEWLQSLFS
ncbi:MAG: hypothetical protein ACFNYQ_11995 [Treponema sp.]|jgi:hypothetical protein|uniref:hypothetical protein n=1 Tax=Treponema sp. TaxID=166 RepID=UPI003606AE11